MPRAGRIVLCILVLLMLCCELLLTGADLGLWGSARWRPLAYQHGAFWAGLLHGWRPNYALQPELMFFSYGFLHAGMAHMLGNITAVIVFGLMVIERTGVRGLLVVWCLALPGGAAGFGLLTASAAPMVGASGAIFGLVGALIVWHWQDERRRDPRRAASWVLSALAGLVVINALMWLSMDGILAWETHLGGLIAGAVAALFPHDKQRKTRDPP